MKKLLLVLVLLSLSLLGLNGCGASDDAFVDDAKTVTLEGILAKQSGDDGFSGTHTVRKDDGELLPLRSIAINLSDKKYLDNRVQLIAVLDPSDGVYTVTGLSVLERISDADIDVEFLQYMNSDLGFRIGYYDDWELDESDAAVEFKSPYYLDEEGAETDDYDIFIVSQSPFSYSRSVFDSEHKDSPLLSYAASSYPAIQDIDPYLRSIGSDGMEALMIEDDSAAVSYFVYRNGLIFEIRFQPADEESEYYSIFNEMLASFQFVGMTADSSGSSGTVGVGATIPEPDSSLDDASSEDAPVLDLNFSYFESLPYSFRAVYPASWYYAGASSPDPSVRHHYGFSDESIEGDNELLSLDVVSGSVPDGRSFTMNNFEITEQSSGDIITFYTSLDGQSYRISGEPEYRDLMLVMLTSITTVEHDEE